MVYLFVGNEYWESPQVRFPGYINEAAAVNAFKHFWEKTEKKSLQNVSTDLSAGGFPALVGRRVKC